MTLDIVSQIIIKKYIFLFQGATLAGRVQHVSSAFLSPVVFMEHVKTLGSVHASRDG